LHISSSGPKRMTACWRSGRKRWSCPIP
jgi:hypothetical protein